MNLSALPAMGFLSLIGLLAVGGSPLAAETLSSPDYNFALELPANWKRSQANPPAVAVAQNADGTKVVVVVATAVPDAERTSAAANMLAGAKESTKEKGWPIIEERQVTANGITFDTFTARMSDAATTTTWIISAGDKAYALSGICKAGEAAKDSELQSALRSFHFLSSVPQNTAGIDRNSAAYRIGHMLPPLVLLAVLIGGVIWMIRRSRRKSASAPQRR